LCSPNCRTDPPFSAFHSRTVASPPAVRNWGSLPKNVSRVTWFWWPRMSRTFSPFS
jgi:hypothetical protein